MVEARGRQGCDALPAARGDAVAQDVAAAALGRGSADHVDAAAERRSGARADALRQPRQRLPRVGAGVVAGERVEVAARVADHAARRVDRAAQLRCGDIGAPLRHRGAERPAGGPAVRGVRRRRGGGLAPAAAGRQRGRRGERGQGRCGATRRRRRPRPRSPRGRAGSDLARRRRRRPRRPRCARSARRRVRARRSRAAGCGVRRHGEAPLWRADCPGRRARKRRLTERAAVLYGLA